MSELYLIAHKVRNEPAFDIAQKLQIGDEEGWIIPTSGHRAYPYWTEPLSELRYYSEEEGYTTVECPSSSIVPPDWPDHYSATPAPRGQGLISNLAERLGLVKRPTITRR